MTKTKLTKPERQAVVDYIREHRREHPTHTAVFQAAVEKAGVQDKIQPTSSNVARYMQLVRARKTVARRAPAPQDGILNGSLAPHSVQPVGLTECPACHARFYIAKGGV